MTDNLRSPFGGESTSAAARRRADLIDRLAQCLMQLGFEPTHLGAADAESGVVDVVLSTLRQMAGLLHLQNGWYVPAGKLQPGMVIDYSPMQSGQEPCTVEVQDVVATGAGTGLVRVYGEDGFVSGPIAEEFPFQLVTEESRDLEEAMVGVETRRLLPAEDDNGRRHALHLLNGCRRFS